MSTSRASAVLGTLLIVMCSHRAHATTSGQLFTISRQRRLRQPTVVASFKSDRAYPTIGKTCKKWAVITSIFEPTKTVHQLASLPEWCVVVVGDKKSPSNYTLPGTNTVYLGPDDQKALPYAIVERVPWNHFGRKNIGFMYAIHHGAEHIYDTDDDNELLEADLSDPFDTASKPAHCLPKAYDAVNPYPCFGASHTLTHSRLFTWPRGFPLDDIKNERTLSCPHWSANDSLTTNCQPPAVVQSLANHDPDVDAIHRLTRPLPITFDYHSGVMSLPSGTMAPLNSQALLASAASFWGLWLPVTVHGRVSDIWRGYIWQRLLWEVGLHAGFASPWVVQHRNPHTYLADFESENDLYQKAGELVRWLTRWRHASTNLTLAALQLTVDLYEHGILEEADVLLHVAWMQDLAAAGYKMPPLSARSEPAASKPHLGRGHRHSTPHADNDSAGFVDVANFEKSNRALKKAAVCVSGQLRTVNMTIERLKSHFFDVIDDYDVFAYIQTRETAVEPAVNDTSACNVFQRRAHNVVLCEVVKEQAKNITDFMTQETAQLWWTHDYPANSNLVQGVIQQQFGMAECNRMRKEYTQRANVEYEYVVRLRPDNWFYDRFPPLPRVNSSNKNVIYISEIPGGNEDLFQIGLTATMDKMMDRLYELKSFENELCPRDKPGKLRRGNLGWCSEDYVMSFAERHNISLQTLPGLRVHVKRWEDGSGRANSNSNP